jgi:hypothetical protein
MRRFLVLLSLVTSAVISTPAAAQVSECEIAEQVYAVDRFGDLTVQPFCVMPGGVYLQPPRLLASFGGQLPRLFYGGQLTDATVVIYGVGADGNLRWYRENSATGRLGPGVVVGSQFGDWRNYQHLQTAGSGDLSGVDAHGRLWRWVHTGWQEGTDTWAAGGPENAGAGCEGIEPIFTGRDGPERYVGVEAKTSSYVYCGYAGEVRVASLLPNEVDAVTMAVGPGVTYALRQADQQLIRMILDTHPQLPRWHASALGRGPFTAIFTGRTILAGEPSPPAKYEWQWTWYIECS